ncbi:MAG: 50S ribosomal protein L25/general stress protein Ctc [Tannerella sp.]|jgi:large subunit ribosomal protein L25|nr:50S ribosomal protein L25/general stress protein Ctc [Tannerella sp.]
MNTFQLEATPRDVAGKKATKAVRKNGLIPAILYGRAPVELPYTGELGSGEKIVGLGDNKAVVVTDLTVTKESVRNLIYTPNIYVIELTVRGGRAVKAILKDIQFHPVTDAVLHIDFLEVFEDKPIVMEVPVALEGHAEGVKAGGKLNLELRKLRVKALYGGIPERLVINVDKLGLGKAVKVGDLQYDNLELVNAKNAVVCAVKLTRAARGMEAAASATQSS